MTTQPAGPPDPAPPDPAPPDPAPPDPPPPAASWRHAVAPEAPSAATRDREAPRGGRRWLVAICAALLGAAAALEGAAHLAWFTVGVDAVGRGTVTVTATGADLVPALTGVAVLAVAAVAATVALAGPARRVLGGLVAAVGAWAGGTVVRLVVAPPASADLAALPGAPAGGTLRPGAAAMHAGPLPGALAALLMLSAGVVMLLAERRLSRFGARYTGRAAAHDREADPDRAAWDALDAGHDPTVEPPGAARPGRTDGRAPGPAV